MRTTYATWQAKLFELATNACVLASQATCCCVFASMHSTLCLCTCNSTFNAGLKCRQVHTSKHTCARTHHVCTCIQPRRVRALSAGVGGTLCLCRISLSIRARSKKSHHVRGDTPPIPGTDTLLAPYRVPHEYIVPGDLPSRRAASFAETSSIPPTKKARFPTLIAYFCTGFPSVQAPTQRNPPLPVYYPVVGGGGLI